MAHLENGVFALHHAGGLWIRAVKHGGVLKSGFLAGRSLQDHSVALRCHLRKESQRRASPHPSLALSYSRKAPQAMKIA